MTSSPAQLQQACDLINRSDDGNRMDAVQMKCKAGKPCNGRCIPQSHQCAPKIGHQIAAAGALLGVAALANHVGSAAAVAALARKPGAKNEAPPQQNQAKQAPPQNQANEEEARKQRYEQIKKQAAEAEQKNGFGKKSESQSKPKESEPKESEGDFYKRIGKEAEEIKAEKAAKKQAETKQSEPKESGEDFYKRVGPDIEKARQETEAKRAAKGSSGSSEKEQAAKAEGEAFKKHLSENPEKQATYNKAIKDAHAKYGMNGAKQVHKSFKDNWRKQSGSPDPKASHDENWHKTLGVSKDASASQIKKAYRDLSKKHHPDKGGNADKFHAVKAAYESSRNRKDAESWQQSIENAYRSAQKQHPLVSSYFW